MKRMVVECIVLYAVCFLLTRWMFKSLQHPAVLFNAWWLFLLVISGVGFDGIDMPSEEVYTIFFIGGVCFNCGVILSLFISNKGILRLSKPKRLGYTEWCTPWHGRVILYAEMVLFGYYLLELLQLLPLLGSGMFYEEIRTYYFSGANFASQWEYLLVQYIFDPWIRLTEILFAVSLFRKLFSNPLKCLMLANILLRTVLSGGRIFLVELVVLIVFAYMLFGGHKALSFKKKIGMVLIVGVATVMAVGITSGRGREGTFLESIQEMIVMNFTGSFTYFDCLMRQELFVEPTYGTTTIAGIVDPFIFILRTLKLTDMPLRQIMVGNVTANFYQIGSYYYNAMPTMYYYFMTDFGYVGIVMFSLLLGVITAMLYNKLIRAKKNTMRHLVVYMMIILTIFKSPMNWMPLQASFVFMIPYAMYLFRKR